MSAKRFSIRYNFTLDNDSVDAWHVHVATFISEIENDPALQGRLSYLCLKDEETEHVSGSGSVEVSPREPIAASK
ncbi:MAG: hypothetical protein JWM82_632 [Myxococcales bacterium]|jgi:hypothetical protein|nr:hypothetical protein [Myxococcales bacterium]